MKEFFKLKNLKTHIVEFLRPKYNMNSVGLIISEMSQNFFQGEQKPKNFDGDFRFYVT